MQVGNPHTRRRKWDQVVILSVALVLSEAKELSAFLGARLLKRRDSFLRKTLRKTQGVLRTGASLGMTASGIVGYFHIN